MTDQVTLKDKKDIIKEVKRLMLQAVLRGTSLDMNMDATRRDDPDLTPIIRRWIAEIESENHP